MRQWPAWRSPSPRRPGRHPRRRLLPLPRLRRPRRRADRADRRRPGRPRRAAAQRARPHRRARRLAHHGDPGLRSCCATPGTPRPGRAAGTFTRVPGGRSRAHDRALVPGAGGRDDVDRPQLRRDLRTARASPRPTPPRRPSCRRTSAGTATSPPGCPRCRPRSPRSYDARGLPTDPDQVVVTAGRAGRGRAGGPGAHRPARPGAGRVAGLPQRDPGDRATAAPGCARSPVDPDGWDLDAVGAALDEVRPTLAYLIPDFQNPTGHVMTDAERATYAAHLRRTGTVAVVDEAHQALALDGQAMPRAVRGLRPAHDHPGQREQVALGRPAAGLDPRAARPGRADHPRPPRPRPRRAGDGAARADPAARRPTTVVERHRDRLREQRDALLAAVTEHLPEWRFRAAGRRAGAVVRAARGPRHGAGRRGRAARRRRRPGPGVRRRGRARPVRADPVVASRRPSSRRPCRRLAAAWDVVRDRSTVEPSAGARVMVA